MENCSAQNGVENWCIDFGKAHTQEKNIACKSGHCRPRTINRTILCRCKKPIHRKARQVFIAGELRPSRRLPTPFSLCIELSKPCNTKHEEDITCGTMTELPSRITVTIPCSAAARPHLCGVWNLSRWIDDDSRVQWSVEECEDTGGDVWIVYRDSNREYALFLQPSPHEEVIEYRSFPGTVPHGGELRVFRIGPDNGFPHDLRLTVTHG